MMNSRWKSAPQIWAFAGVVAVTIVGCGSSDPTVNPGIANYYQAFYDAGPNDPAAARRATDAAIAADPDNAYGYYLRASLEASISYDAALKWVEDGNRRTKTVIYVSAPPPEDSMQSVARIRQLGFTAARASDLGVRQPSYAAALRTMGARVAKAEPTASLAVLNGAGVVRAAYKAEIAYWNSRKDIARAKRLGEGQARFDRWYDEMQDGLTATVRDLIRDAGRQAGMSEDQVVLYAAGKDVGDQAKQAKANQAKEAMYRQEIQTLRKFLNQMPEVKS